MGSAILGRSPLFLRVRKLGIARAIEPDEQHLGCPLLLHRVERAESG